MYLHLGNNYLVNTDNVIGIFDIENTSTSSITKNFLSNKNKAYKIINVSYDMPKSFIICMNENKEQFLYISNISVSVITSYSIHYTKLYDISPSKMKKLEDRMKSRFVLGVQVDVQAPDFETRMAIIKRKAELLDLNLPDSVARIIAEKIKTNIRQLEGAVNKIKGLTLFSNETPSISMAQRVIKENLIDNQPAEITVEKILTEVANAFNVSAEDIRSQNRNAQISLARKVAILISYNFV